MTPGRLDGGALAALCSQGLALHQAGRIDEARHCYEAVLEADPDHIDALHLLGVVYIQTGRLELAVQLIGRATAIKPDLTGAHGNLANALNALGRHEEALAATDRAIALQSDFAEAHGNRGLALLQLGRMEQALSSYARAAALKPDQARSHYNTAIVLRELGRLDEALAAFDRAVARDAAFVEAHSRRGITLRELGRPEEALNAFARAIALRPDHAEAWYNQAIALRELRRPEEAVASYDRAIAIRPDHAEALSNRGNALVELQLYGEALLSYEAAIALKPDFADAFRNRGVLLMDFRQLEGAVADFDRAVALKPDFAEAHYNRAVARLMAGDYAAGWAEYEWRWGTGGFQEAARGLNAPLWLGGEDIRGRTILLHAEQGLGDALQFCRYVPKVAALGARVVLEVYPGLERLLARLEGVDEVVARGQPLPPQDLQTPLASLPLALGAPEPDARQDPYLSADPEAAAAWATRLDGDKGLRVGLCWAGGLRPGQAIADAVDRRRSLPLEAFAPLAEAAGVSFYSLQKGPPSAQLAEAEARGWPGPPIIDLTEDLHDFADTAALVANLDLLITCDTAVAHLAGALGKPVWILNRYDACWRWLTERADSPWYPSARLFRQDAPGNWAGVMEAVKAALG